MLLPTQLTSSSVWRLRTARTRAHDSTQVAVAWKRLRRLVPYVALIYNCKLAWAHARLNPDGGSGFADLREDFVAHGGSA